MSLAEVRDESDACLVFSVDMKAQTAPLPTPKDFKVGETWEFRFKIIGEGRVTERTDKFVVDAVAPKLVVDGLDDFLERRYVSDGVTAAIPGKDLAGASVVQTPWRVWPLKVGASWKFYGAYMMPHGEVNQLAQKVVVSAYEDVRVPAGVFKAFRIEHEGIFYDSHGKSFVGNDKYWYAPSIKMDIKYLNVRGDDEFLHELARYQPSIP